MTYAIYRRSSGAKLDSLSMHVLARAYRSAWWALYACEPVGAHVIEGLDVLIEFPQRPARPRNDTSDESRDT